MANVLMAIVFGVTLENKAGSPADERQMEINKSRLCPATRKWNHFKHHLFYFISQRPGCVPSFWTTVVTVRLTSLPVMINPAGAKRQVKVKFSHQNKKKERKDLQGCSAGEYPGISKNKK